MRIIAIIAALWLLAVTGQLGFGQSAPSFEQPTKQRFQVGVIIRAGSGSCSGITATMPVPMDWPEQQVKIVDQEKTSQVRRISYRTLDDGVRQMAITIPRLAAGQTAKAVVTFEVTKSNIRGPENRDAFSLPKSSRGMSKYLGTSPYIETRHPKIRELAKQAIAGKDDAWQQVESIYDLSREKVQYKFDVKLKGALAALEDGYGDCEELTSLFVAMCRVNKIPARCVWIPGHCYPEFYLQDARGKGHWFPCQAAGDKQFGSMTESRPILQKGDSFRVSGKRKPQRYVAPTLTAKNAQASPEVQWVQKILPAQGGVNTP